MNAKPLIIGLPEAPARQDFCHRAIVNALPRTVLLSWSTTATTRTKSSQL